MNVEEEKQLQAKEKNEKKNRLQDIEIRSFVDSLIAFFDVWFFFLPFSIRKKK